MGNTIEQKYQETLDALSYLRDVLYNTKATKEESAQEELITQAENLAQEAYKRYKKIHEGTRK